MRKSFKLLGNITWIGDTKVYLKKDGKNLYKKVITIETDDGQVLYPEIRGLKIPIFTEMKIEIPQRVELEYFFEGSEKNNKKYNNIYVESIKII